MRKTAAFVMALCLLFSMVACGSPKEYTVEFNPGRGDIISGKATQTVAAGEDAKAPKVEREGYAFMGWDGDYTNVQSDMTIKAIWAGSYTIVFDPAGGKISSGEEEQQVIKGEMPEEPTVDRQDYRFIGWDKEITAATKDVTYTAKWEAVSLSAGSVYDHVSDSMVEITVYDTRGDMFALGSGFFIDDKGTIVTNYHVIEGAASAVATLYNDESYDITGVIAYDEALDMAVIKCDIASSIPLPISQRKISTGDTVYTLGSSLGVTDTFSNGIVSNPSRIIDGEDFIQITAPISHGNSGGPLVNEYGEVIGINSWTYTDGQNMNFSINIHELDKLQLDAAPITMSQFYSDTYSSVATQTGNYTIVSTGDEGEEVYSIADYIECEENGDIPLADVLVNSSWTAAYLDPEDLDFFSITLDKRSTVEFYIFNYWADDDEYLAAMLVDENIDAITDVNGEIGILTDTVDEEGFFVRTLTLDPGTYYIGVFLQDGYPYENGAYYLVAAVW